MANRFAPMGTGMETDMVTGEPMAVAQLDREARRQERQARTLERHERLIVDLAGAGGEVVRAIASQLVQRIEVLIQEDPEAKAYMGLLSLLEQQKGVGTRIVQESLQTILSEDVL